jgi:hypothetical protein
VEFDVRGAVALAVGVAGPPLLAWWIAHAVMVTEVTRDIVRVNFTWPWSSRTIPLSDVRGHAVGHKPPITESYQGTQSVGRVSMFSATGRDGVNLELAEGKRVFIGSQRADELDAAIKRALGA